jgi:hypothetical protein
MGVLHDCFYNGTNSSKNQLFAAHANRLFDLTMASRELSRRPVPLVREEFDSAFVHHSMPTTLRRC